MPTTIESLELQVQQNATSAVGGIDALSASLSRLKNAVKGGVGLNSVANQVRNLDTALKSVDGSSADKINRLADSLSKLKGLGNIKLSSSIGNQLKNISSAASALNSADLSGLGKLSAALQPLNNIGKASGLKSAITQLQKLPQLAQTLNGINWATLTSQLQQLSNSLAPLASQLNTVSNAFGRLPTNIRRVVTATNALPAANNRAATSYVNLWAKFTMAIQAVRTGARVIASWITESNSYIENLNLFNASMGKYTEEARRYAEQVGELMGIDPGEFMRNQGIFMTITEGFGVASDRAYIMSKNLTQLGYDLSSFFNISFADAMQKLESGISGELEPLRRLGYDLSQARLQQEAWNLGIERNITDMTQAEKAQLRYYAIMTQVTTAQGDMARTLNAPANQLRILQSQVVQAARALGNIFIPILNAVLPYAIALAKVIRILANTIASFFGFKLPEIDYSGVSAGASAVGDLADNAGDAGKGLGNAAKGAKKLKNALLGIDELNIISPNDSSSLGSGGGAGGVGGIGGGDLGFELPEYDFIGNVVASKVDEILQKMKEWLGLTDEINTWGEFFHTRLGRILTTVGAIGLGFAAWKIGKGVLNALQYLSNLKKAGLGSPLNIVVGISLLVTGVALEWAGIIDAIMYELNSMNFGQIVSGGLLTVGGSAFFGKGIAAWITKVFSGSAVATALQTAASNLGLGSATAAGSALGAGIGGIIAGLPMYFTGIWDAIKNGLNWLNGILIPTGSTMAAAGIGAIIGACGGPIGAGIGALIGLVIGALTDLGIWLYQNWDEVKTWFLDKWKSVTNFFTVTIPNWWNGSVVPFFQSIPEWFRGVLESIRNWFVEKWTAITTFMSGLPAKIGSVINSVIEWFSSLPGKIGYALGFALGKVTEWATNVFDYLRVKIPQIIGNVVKWFSELPGKIYNAISSTISKVVTWGSEVFSKFREKVSQIITNVRSWFSELPGKIYSAISGAVTKISTWCSDMISKIKSEVPKVIDKVIEFFKGIPGKLKKLGSDIIQGLLDGISNAWESLKSGVSDFCGGFVQGFKDALGINSPSRVFKELGGFSADGLVQGVKEKFSNVKSTFTEWAENIKSWFTDNGFGGINSSTFSTFANNTIEGFKTKIGTAYANVKTNVTTWASKAKEWFTSSSFGGINSTTFSNFANNTIEGFKNKIGSAYSNTKTNITTWASKAKEWFTSGSFGGVNANSFSTFANNAIEGFKNKIGNSYTNSRSNMQTWATNVKNWFSGIASNSAFSGFGTSVIDGFKNRIGGYYTAAKSNMHTFASSVKSWFTDYCSSNSFYNIASDVVNGFSNGIGSLYRTCKNTITSWGSSIISWFKDKLDINSPSRVFYDMGMFTVKGYDNAISNEGKSTRGIVSRWFNSFSNITPNIKMPKINAPTIPTARMAFAVDTSALSYYDSASFDRTVRAEVSNNHILSADGFGEAMEKFYEERIEPTFNRMAEDMRRQADKKETTVVKVGNKTVTDAIVTQENANGYSFTG